MTIHSMPFGAEPADTGTRFRLWAPAVKQVMLEIDDRRLPMEGGENGWHELHVPDAGAGTRYRFDVGNKLRVPDPASRFNPDDIAGASQVIDPRAYEWRDAAWRGRPWHEAVVYELHIGTFTPEGNYAAAAKRLPELAALGITAVELMPVADFPGKRGWGYDGVLMYAPDAAYGTPDELKAFVDEAHAHGLMVLLDVVYNHFGPEGNYLHAYCPQFFNAEHQTPWGAAINFDGESNKCVRDFFRHNALYWVEEFHFDGLRMDAVHAIHDSTPLHIAAEIGQALRAGPGQHRQVHLVLENDANRASLLERGTDGEPIYATAQWNDDLHHAAHVALTGETDGYYSDFDGELAESAIGRLGRALAQGFIYQGQPSAHRGGVPHGEPSGHLPGTAFVSFVQNHDQTGNRAMGERLAALTDAPRLDAMYACLLLSPHVPMLFMGEEFAASAPFLYFCDFGPELAEAVSTGRRAEFARFAAFRDEAARAQIPDPNVARTFEMSRIDWAERESGAHAERLALVKHLLELRREHLVPRLAHTTGGGRHRFDGELLHVGWPLAGGAWWRLTANLGTATYQDSGPIDGQVIFSQGLASDGNWPPGAVRITLETAAGRTQHG